MSVRLIKKSSELPLLSELQFGKCFADHMFKVKWTESDGWESPEITPLEPLMIHPAAKVLHYSMECFEGMKAFHGVDGKVRLFRPEMNMARLKRSCERLGLPTFNEHELLECIKHLLRVDSKFVPREDGFSLYLRPTCIATSPNLGVSAPTDAELFVICSPVGPYFPQGLKPVKLFVDEEHVRAWPGGVGNVKAGGNYAPTIVPMKKAAEHGCQQVLYTISHGAGDEGRFISEAGAMNMFLVFAKKDGSGLELVTPPLDGTILPGVTRDSILALCREWNEFDVNERQVSVAEIQQAHREGRVKEMFGCGTACLVTPVCGLQRTGHPTMEIPLDVEDHSLITIRILNAIKDIQYGKTPSKWSVPVQNGVQPVPILVMAES